MATIIPIDPLVQKVKINRYRELTVVFRLNLLELMQLQLPDFCQIQRAGTYSHTQ